MLATKAVPAGAVGVEDKETDPGRSVTMLGPGRQVPPSPHCLQILAKCPRPTAAQGLTHAARLAHPCFPEVCAWGMGIPATRMSPSTKSLGVGNSFRVGKPRVTFLVTILRAKDRAPTMCWGPNQTFISRSSCHPHEALRVEGTIQKPQHRDASRLAPNHIASRSWDLN